MARARPRGGRGRAALLWSGQGRRLLCRSPPLTLHLRDSAASSLFISSSGGIFRAATAAKKKKQTRGRQTVGGYLGKVKFDEVHRSQLKPVGNGHTGERPRSL